MPMRTRQRCAGGARRQRRRRAGAAARRAADARAGARDRPVAPPPRRAARCAPARRRPSLRRHEAEVALDDGEARILVHRAQHRHVGVVLDHRAQLGFVARAAQPGQDHAGDADRAVERLIAEDQRRNAAGHAARIEHQHHRQVQQLRQRRIAVAAVAGRGRRTAPCCPRSGRRRRRAPWRANSSRSCSGVDRLKSRLRQARPVAAEATSDRCNPGPS